MKIPITGTQRLNAVTITTPAFDWRTAAVLLLSLVVGLGAGQAFAGTYTSLPHVFSTADILGDFQGSTYGPAGYVQDETIICSGGDCPTVQDKDNRTLYGIDNEFGFYVTDFAGGVPKIPRDSDHGEGFAANILGEGGAVIGISVANVATDTLRVPSGMGTWCSGLGNTSVKCSAEQYVVMEHVKTCHETIPYIPGDPDRADPTTGAQAILAFDGNPTAVDCADYKLDNALFVVGGVFDEEGNEVWPDGTMIESAQILYEEDELGNYVDGWLFPNESTVLENIAQGSDYSVTGKDDGKPLYRWGDLHKRPNDIRMYARIPLPDIWKEDGPKAANDGLGLRVTSALLYVDHVVTNNPNDQLRPEDMENEGAIGRKPGYVDQSIAGVGLVSDTNCYEADGDFIPITSVYRNDRFPYAPLDPVTWDPVLEEVVGTDPYLWSSDLKGKWSNGFYTTVDREPFEWSYDNNGDGSPDVGSPVPDDTLGTLISGPRWRLTSAKFGQTVPGLEIPLEECSEPPYERYNLKYTVGEEWTTVINLLDWNPKDERSVGPDGDESPLAYTNGWVYADSNDGAVVSEYLDPADPKALEGMEAISVNGAPITEDFDLSVYVKGDKKATELYNAVLVVEYEDYVPPVVVTAVEPVDAPAQALVGDPIPVSFTVNNPNAFEVTANVQICGVGDAVEPVVPYNECSVPIVGAPLLAEDNTDFDWVAPAAADVQNITWTGTVSNISTGDPDDTASASTEVVDVAPVIDVAAVSVSIPPTVPYNTEVTFTVAVTNVGPTATPVGAEICGTNLMNGAAFCVDGSLATLAAGATENVPITWTTPESAWTMWRWSSATATAEGDVDLSNNTLRLPRNTTTYTD